MACSFFPILYYLCIHVQFIIYNSIMRIIKRMSFLLIAILFGYTSVYSQTLADVKMGEVLNNGDLFQIREQYPILKVSINWKEQVLHWIVCCSSIRQSLVRRHQ